MFKASILRGVLSPQLRLGHKPSISSQGKNAPSLEPCAHLNSPKTLILAASYSQPSNDKQCISSETDTTPKVKDLSQWEVLQLDPRGGYACFANSYLKPEYSSYDPPRGYTAEEIMQFQGAKDVFASVDEVRNLIAERDENGTLERKIF